MTAALIIGAREAIAGALVRRLAERCRLVLLVSNNGDGPDVGPSGANTGAGASIVPLAVDPRPDGDPAEIAGHMIDQAHAVADDLDLVVNVARPGDLEAADTDAAAAVRRHLLNNAVAPVIATLRFAAGLSPGRLGHVINVIDPQAGRASADHVGFGLSQVSLAAATRELASALAPRVRVNAIAADLIARAEGSGRTGTGRPGERSPLAAAPGGSGQIARSVAHAADYLCQTPSITGMTINVGGAGAVAGPPWRGL